MFISVPTIFLTCLTFITIAAWISMECYYKGLRNGLNYLKDIYIDEPVLFDIKNLPYSYTEYLIVYKLHDKYIGYIGSENTWREFPSGNLVDNNISKKLSTIYHNNLNMVLLGKNKVTTWKYKEILEMFHVL